MHTIAVCNQKGGSCKTTTTVCLAGCLVEQGYKVLLIDMDPQADSSKWLGLERPRNKPRRPGLLNLLRDEVELGEVIEQTSLENLDVVAAHIELARANRELAGEPGAEHLLQIALENSNQQWDWVLIDCPPGVEMLTINALAAAQDVVIPAVPRVLDVEGVPRLMLLVETLKRRRVNTDLNVLGILLCQFDGRQRAHKQLAARIKKAAGSVVFDTKIRKNIRLEEAPGFKQPIHLFAPKSNGATDYRSFTQEILKRRVA